MTTCHRCFDEATTTCCPTHGKPLCDRHQHRHDNPGVPVRPVRASTLRSAS